MEGTAGGTAGGTASGTVEDRAESTDDLDGTEGDHGGLNFNQYM